jgi:hypothetical protein
VFVTGKDKFALVHQCPRHNARHECLDGGVIDNGLNPDQCCEFKTAEEIELAP